MVNMKIVVAIAVVVALMIGGVIDVKVYPAELPKVPARLLALVEGEEYLEQGQDYVKNLFASMKSDDSESEETGEDKEEKTGEVAGSKDEKEETEEKKDTQKSDNTKKEPKIDFEGVSIPLRF